jgi:hypothetical protein
VEFAQQVGLGNSTNLRLLGVRYPYSVNFPPLYGMGTAENKPGVLAGLTRWVVWTSMMWGKMLPAFRALAGV